MRKGQTDPMDIKPTYLAPLMVAWLCLAPHQVLAQSPFVGPPLPAEPGSRINVDPIPVPKSDEEIRSRQETINSNFDTNAAKIAKLTEEAAKKEPGAGDKDYLAALSAVTDTMKVYQAQLAEYADLRQQVKGLEDDATTVNFTEELTRLQRAIDEAQQHIAQRLGGVSAEELQRVEAELATVNTNLAARIKSQEERAQRRTEAPARLESLKADVETAQVALNQAATEFEARRATLAPDTPEYDAAELTLDRFKYDAGTALLRLSRFELEARREVVLSAQSEQRLPLLRQLAAEHEKRVERFRQLRTRSQIQMAREQLAEAKAHSERTSAYEMAYLELRVRVLERRQELSDMQTGLGTRERFTASDSDALKADLAADVAQWSPLMEVLDRKSGDKIKAYYRRIGELESSRRADLQRLQAHYDTSLDDRVRVTDRIDLVDEDLREGWRKLGALGRNEEYSESVVRFTPAVKELRESLESDLNETRSGLDALVDRLAEAMQLLIAHVDHLAAQRSRMYWSYLRVQDQPLWKYRWSETGAEWNAEAPKREAVLSALRGGVEAIPPLTAFLVSGVLLAILVASWVLRRKWLIYADSLEVNIGARLVESEQIIAPFSDRFHLQAIRFFARTAPVIFPSAAAWIWIGTLSPLDGRLAGTAMGILMVAGLLFGLISTLFSRTKPRYRLVPCSNVVAGHYRLWLRILLYTSVLLTPIPILLTVLDEMSYTRNYLWSVYRIAALLIVLLFAFSRQTVLRVVGRPEQVRYQLVYLFIATGYPILYLGVVALLVMQVMGFGPLVSYLVAGAAQSLVAIFLAMLVVRYSRDIVLRLGQRLTVAREGAAEGPTSVEREHAEALAAGREVTLLDRSGDTFDQQLWLGVALAVFRWTVGLATLVLILGFWGVRRVDLRSALEYVLIPGAENRPEITIGRALAAVAMVVFTWVFSRAVRAFLEARVFPAYSSLDRGGRVAISTLLHYMLVFMGLYFSLYIVQIPLGALTVVLGTLGLGLGLGLQPVFINFLSGIIILFERHVKVGDLIEVKGVLGEVSGVSLRATTIKTYDNVDMVIPNSEFVSGSVTNWTMNDPRIRGKIEVGVAYDSDVRLVERLLLQMARESKLVLKEPPPRVRFTQFGDNSLNFVLFAWFYNATDRWDFMTDGRFRMLELFRENDIEIPFPQQSLSISGDKPLRVEVEHRSRSAETMRREDSESGERPPPSHPTEKPAGRR